VGRGERRHLSPVHERGNRARLLCHEGEPCWLLDRVLEEVSQEYEETFAEPMADLFTILDAASEEHKRVLFRYLAHGLGEDAVRDTLKVMATV